MRFWILLAITLLVAATVFAGNLYYWKDDNGVMQFGQRPPKQGMTTANAPKQVKEKSSASVDIYVTDRCPYCKQAMRYLQSKGVRFNVYNVERDQGAAKRMLQLSKGSRAVPFAMIYGEPVIGFAPGIYDKALSARK